MKQLLMEVKKLKISEIFGYLFLITLPFNLRVIYNPTHAYIEGYFSYYLAFFLYLSDLAFVVWFISYLVEKRGLERINRVNWPMLGFILAILAGMFHVKHDLHWFFYSFLKVIEVIFVIFLVSRATLNWRILYWIIYISGLFQAIIGIWQFHVQHSIGLGLLGEYVAPIGTGGLATLDSSVGKIVRAYGTFPHPNILGLFLIIGLILGYFLIVSRETGRKTQFFLIFGDYLLIVGIFLTFSRVSWVIAAFATILFLWYVRKREKWLRLAIFLPAIVSCATIFLFWHGLLFNRVANIETSKSYTERVSLNDAGLTIFEENSVLGTGIGGYIPTMMDKFHVEPWEYQPSHNIYIYLAASIGVVGMFFLIWVFFQVGQSLWNAPPSDLKFTLTILALSLLLVSNFDHFPVTIQQGQLMLALILGLILKSSRDSHAF